MRFIAALYFYYLFGLSWFDDDWIYDFGSRISQNFEILVFHFVVLVGAFSDFRHADTGKPVQIFGHFAILVLSLGILGLI